MPVRCCDINDDGDIEIAFPGLVNGNDEFLRVDIRLGLALNGVQDTIDVVDASSMVTKGGTMTVHGGWIRNAIGAENLEGTTEGWDIVIIQAVASDPENEYRVVSVMKEPKKNGLSANQAHKREKLSRKPSQEESVISDEMKFGKKPSKKQRERRLGGRRLSSTHKQILVHGYCAAASPFPVNHFSNAISFSDPDVPNPQASSWSHDLFARKIDKFADDSGIHGCGCIAHSQGGAACLHLYTY